MNVIPWIFDHGMIGQSPGFHFAERESDDVFETQGDDPGGMTKRFHLIDFERDPEHQ